MQVFICKACGSEFDFVSIETDRLCGKCAGPLEHKGQEESPWGTHPRRELDDSIRSLGQFIRPGIQLPSFLKGVDNKNIPELTALVVTSPRQFK